MVVIREDQQGENKKPKVELLQHWVPFSARGTLPPRELPRIQMDPRQLRLQHKRDKVNRLRVVQDHAQHAQLGDFEVLRQADQDWEDAQKQTNQKLAAQAEQTRPLDERKRIKKRETDAKKAKTQGSQAKAKRGTKD
jgi:hypothetical protein